MKQQQQQKEKTIKLDKNNAQHEYVLNEFEKIQGIKSTIEDLASVLIKREKLVWEEVNRLFPEFADYNKRMNVYANELTFILNAEDKMIKNE